MGENILDKHFVKILPEICKGCGLCISACPQNVLAFHEKFNSKGFHYAYYKGEDCTGCFVCFYACPEPEAVEIYKKGHLLPIELEAD